MPRPKSPDPKLPVTLRIRASTLARYEALGVDWRVQMEAAVERFGLPALPLPQVPRSPAIHVDVPVYERKAFNPRPKTGKKR
jgi:hypothetical protein